MGEPCRIQLSRKAGWRKPEGAVVVSRPGKFGNPFEATKGSDGWYIYEPHSRQRFDLGSLFTRADAQAFAVRLYAAWLKGDLVTAELELRRRWILDNLGGLVGRSLCCWCPEGTACHADTLLKMAAEIGGDH